MSFSPSDESDEDFDRRQAAKAKTAMVDANYCRLCDGEPSISRTEDWKRFEIYCTSCPRVVSAASAAAAVDAWNLPIVEEYV